MRHSGSSLSRSNSVHSAWRNSPGRTNSSGAAWTFRRVTMPPVMPRFGQAVNMRIWTLSDEISLYLQCFMLIWWKSPDVLDEAMVRKEDSNP